MNSVPVSFGPFRMDPEHRRLSREGTLLHLGDRAFDILSALVEAEGRLVTKKQLMAKVWPDVTVDENSIHVHVSALRRALGDGANGESHVVTVRGRGYRLIGLKPERDSQGQVTPGSGGPLIAVLPFSNLSGDPDQDYFAEGIVEDIITALSRMRSFSVIARNSSFAFKGKPVGAREIGKALGVRYILTGSVRKSADRVRVAGQLIDTDTMANLWAGKFDGRLEDIFDVQDRVTESVVGALASRLEQAEIERAERKPTESLEAYDYYLRALPFVYRGTREASSEALRLLHLAIELDPEFSSPVGLAAACYMSRRSHGWAEDPASEAAEGVRLARSVAQLARADAAALALAGLALADVGRDPEAGAAMVDRALLLNPNLSVVLIAGGWLRTWLGQTDVAIEHLSRAMRLSPLDPLMVALHSAVATSHFLADRHEEALTAATKALAEGPDYDPALRVLAASYASLGRQEQAKAVVAKLLSLDPQLSMSTLRQRLAPFKEDAFGRFARALRKAGLPEELPGNE